MRRLPGTASRIRGEDRVKWFACLKMFYLFHLRRCHPPPPALLLRHKSSSVRRPLSSSKGFFPNPPPPAPFFTFLSAAFNARGGGGTARFFTGYHSLSTASLAAAAAYAGWSSQGHKFSVIVCQNKILFLSDCANGHIIPSYYKLSKLIARYIDNIYCLEVE